MGAIVSINYLNVFIDKNLPIQNNAMYIFMDHLGFDESVVAGPKPQGGLFFPSLPLPPPPLLTEALL